MHSIFGNDFPAVFCLTITYWHNRCKMGNVYETVDYYHSGANHHFDFTEYHYRSCSD